MKSDSNSCKYCNKPLEKIKCPKNGKDIFWYAILFDLWAIVLYVTFFLLSLIFKNIERKERDRKSIITCTNKDCINYLNGCFDNKGLYS